MPDSDVAFDPNVDLDASGRHAEVRREGDTFILTDVGSRNGTFVNGRRLYGPHTLTTGDEIEFGTGGPRMRVEVVLPMAHTSPSPSRPEYAPTMAAPATAPIGDDWAPKPTRMPEAPASHPGAMTGPMSAPVPFPSHAPSPVAPPAPHAPQVPPAPRPSMPGQSSPQQHAPLPQASPPARPSFAPRQVPPAPQAGPSDKKYGERTVGLMIQTVADQVRRSLSGNQMSTGAVRTIAGQESDRRLLGVALGCAALALVSLLAIGLYFAFRTTEPTREELGVITAEVTAAQGASLHRIFAKNGETETLLCLAFGVRPNVLATAAQCVVAMEEPPAGTTFLARVGTESLAIERMWKHPNYNAPPSPDVGLVQVAGTVTPMPLAAMTEVTGVAMGDYLILLNHGGDVLASSAVAVTGLLPIEGGQALSYEATAFSGAPLLNAEGHVVGIHARTATTAGAGYGVRGDALLGLLAGLPQ